MKTKKILNYYLEKNNYGWDITHEKTNWKVIAIIKEDGTNAFCMKHFEAFNALECFRVVNTTRPKSFPQPDETRAVHDAANVNLKFVIFKKSKNRKWRFFTSWDSKRAWENKQFNTFLP